MSSTEMLWVLKATDQATAPIEKVDKAQKDLNRTTKEGTESQKRAVAAEKTRVDGLSKLKAGFGAVSVGIAVLGAGVAKANAEFAEQNRLNENLASALRNTGFDALTASFHVAELNKEFDRMSRVTRFDDEQMSQGFELLHGYTRDLESANEDLILTMDLATKSKKDLQATAMTLGKVYAGQYEELVALGLISKSQANAFMQMTDRAEATRQVMQLLRDQTRGLAENLTESEKAARNLNADLDGLWESIGGAINSVLGPLNTELGKIAGSEGEVGVIGRFAAQVDHAGKSWGAFIDQFGDNKVQSALEVAAKLGLIGATMGGATIPLFLAGTGAEIPAAPTAGSQAKPNTFFKDSGQFNPPAPFGPDEDFLNAINGTSPKGKGKAKETDIDFLNSAMDDIIPKLDLARQYEDEAFQARLAAMETARQDARYRLENAKRLEELQKQQRATERAHQEWVINKEREQNRIAAERISQGAGVAQQAAGVAGAPSGVGGIIGGIGGIAGGYMSGNPFAMVSGGLSLFGGIKDLFGGDSGADKQALAQQKQDRERALREARTERVEFQRSLQSAIVDALRESRDNLAVTYVINQSGNYLGNDNASLRQVQSAIDGVARVERRRT